MSNKEENTKPTESVEEVEKVEGTEEIPESEKEAVAEPEPYVLDCNIILEGPDGVGKTTVARLLEEATGFKYLHMPSPKNISHAQFLTEGNIDFLSKTTGYIVDRSFISDIIYSPMYRDHVPTYVEEKLKGYRAWDKNPIMFLEASAETLHDRFDGEYISPEDIPRLITGYKLVKPRFKDMKYATFNTDELTPEQVANGILNACIMLQESRKPKTNKKSKPVSKPKKK